MSWIDKWPAEFRPVLELLAQKLNYDAIWFKQELSGGSGARTYLAAPQGEAGLGLVLIAKLGPKSIIDRDLDGLERAKKFFKRANYALTEPVELGGIKCIAIEVAGAGSGETFREFYAQTKNPEQVSKLIEDLFRDALRRPDLDAKSSPQNLFEMHEFDDRIALARELRKAGDDSQTFVYWWERCREKFTQESSKILSHGDMHSGNVIVVEGKPYVIDFGRTGNRHIMHDLAKFEREIRLFLLPQNSNGTIEDLMADLDSALTHPPHHAIRTSDAEIEKARVAIESIRNLARESLRLRDNWESEYYGALLAQFIFAAGNSVLDLPRRRAALSFAKDLRRWFEEKFPALIMDKDETLGQRREEALWRLAYIFMRLDQLPSGGWSKSLAQWMEAIWEGDDGKISRSPDMRIKGGTDLTAYSFYHYLGFLESHLSPRERAFLVMQNNVAHRMRKNLRSKIVEGGVAPIRANTPRRVRHTLMGLIAFLRYEKANNFDSQASNEIAETVKYLIENLAMWRRDESHLWGMYASLVKLDDMLKQSEYANQIDERDLNKLVNIISEVRRPMRNAVGEATCNPKPEGTYHFPSYDAVPFFAPYFNFWRMERSNFLMYLPYLVSDDGKKFLDPSLRNRCAQCIEQLLDEITAPFRPEDPTASLLPYHRVSQAGHLIKPVSRDWGLSAEFVAALELPVIRDLLHDEQGKSSESLEDKQRALKSALLRTFDGYYICPQIFKFTNGISFGRYLSSIRSSNLALEIKQLDMLITELCSKGVTQDGLNGLIKEALSLSGNPTDADTRALTDMMVDKLESGEHTPDGEICSEKIWDERIANVVNGTTITFYDNVGGEDYTGRYMSPIITFVSRIKDMVDWADCKDRKAVDVGCGPGQYAKLLKDEGYYVELVDMSEKMLKTASDLLELSALPPPRDFYMMEQYFKKEEFDLIFACAMMVHVPLKSAKKIYQSFYHLLKPDGLLFVNFKLGDHTLISSGGRYFQYYRDHSIPMRMLQEAGFDIVEMTMRWNRRNLHDDPKGIRWVNFYCKRLNG